MADAQGIFRLPISWRDPLPAFAPLAQQPWSIGFFSSGKHPMARWSVLCADPQDVILAQGPQALSKLTLNSHVNNLHPDLPFCGGLAGLLSYEFGMKLQDIPETADSAEKHWPDVAFGNYPCCALFDHQTRQAWVIAPDIERAKGFAKKLGDGSTSDHKSVALSNLSMTESDDEIAAKVARAIEYIVAGDIFQANISREFTASLSENSSPFDLFQDMLALSQAPFCASFCLDENKIVLSNSPERFLKLDTQGQVHAHPIKGTRPRAATTEQDLKAQQELLQSAKDRAENLMIVDLMRNDLSKVCQPGSVTVPELFEVQSFANVHHLVSTVRGQLQKGLGPLDVLRAAFPPGSITGAPKIRAMQIIAELEQISRGAYCGALGFISNHGAMDFNVLIRTMQIERQPKQHWTVKFRAGGGIVADSNPLDESKEMRDKASIFTQLAKVGS